MTCNSNHTANESLITWEDKVSDHPLNKHPEWHHHGQLSIQSHITKASLEESHKHAIAKFVKYSTADDIPMCQVSSQSIRYFFLYKPPDRLTHPYCCIEKIGLLRIISWIIHGYLWKLHSYAFGPFYIPLPRMWNWFICYLFCFSIPVNRHKDTQY